MDSGEPFVIMGEGGAGESLVAQSITGYLPRDQEMERVMRIELTSPAWEAGVIPLYDTRLAPNRAVGSSGASSFCCKQPYHAAVLVFDNVAVVAKNPMVIRRQGGAVDEWSRLTGLTAAAATPTRRHRVSPSQTPGT